MAVSSPIQALVSAAASFVLVSIFFGIVYYFCHRPSKHDNSATRSLQPGRHGRARRRTSAPVLPVSSRTPNHPDDSQSFDPTLHISMADLVKATRNFSSDLVVGDGSFGFVYRAKLQGIPVAVKRLSIDAFHGHREFRAEMETLAGIRHPNLVRILGFCASGRDRILVYEFLERGSLDSWLHEDQSHPLPWASRVRIMQGVANGIAYLHDECKPCIIHRDIKASNVLLDADFEARIADFGLARPVDASRSHVSTQIAGTAGYMPPEYHEGNPRATVKHDVYSYGVLMLEAATGRRPNLPVALPPKEGGGKRRELGLVRWARVMLEDAEAAGRKGQEEADQETRAAAAASAAAMEILDPQIDKDGVDPAQVLAYFKLALRCSREIVKERPVMREVAERLRSL